MGGDYRCDCNAHHNVMANIAQRAMQMQSYYFLKFQRTPTLNHRCGNINPL